MMQFKLQRLKKYGDERPTTITQRSMVNASNEETARNNSQATQWTRRQQQRNGRCGDNVPTTMIWKNYDYPVITPTKTMVFKWRKRCYSSSLVLNGMFYFVVCF